MTDDALVGVDNGTIAVERFYDLPVDGLDDALRFARWDPPAVEDAVLGICRGRLNRRCNHVDDFGTRSQGSREVE